MQLLIKNVLVVHPGSKFDGEKVHLFIKDGFLEKIGKRINISGVETLDAEGACVSPGWVDLGTQVGDPGFEHREDFQSVSRAAAAGGFTAIACYPNTYPVIHTKSEVQYVGNASERSVVAFLPIGAISQDCKGKDITEMYDMRAAGAVAFSDGKNPVQDNGLMMRALQYVKPFDGVILNQPFDKTIAPGGQMNEGIISTSLGLRGIPSMAEEMMVRRDLYLAEYTGSRLHLQNISTAGSVQLVREAKAKGLKVTASVAAMNLACDDSLLLEFENNFKVLPPLREPPDVEALHAGLKDGVIDCICSNHVPLDEESKNLEFPFADFGAIGLETAFALSRSVTRNLLTVNELVEKLALAPRQILQIPIPQIAPGAAVDLTIFQPDQEWTFNEKDIFSKSKNTPFLGKTLIGKVWAVVRGNRSFVLK